LETWEEKHSTKKLEALIKGTWVDKPCSQIKPALNKQTERK